MERSSSPRNPNEEGLLSCWGRLKLKLPWAKRKIRSTATTRQGIACCNCTTAFRSKQPRTGGGFRYDPLSYAQNFDDGCWDDDIEGTLRHGFSSRYAAPLSKPIGDK